MRKNKKGKCYRTIFSITLILSFVIAGCGKTDSSQIEADIQEVDDGIGTSTDAAVADISGEIPEQLTYEIANADGSISIDVDADVIVPEVESYSVYEEKPIAFDDDFLKTLAGNLFDGGIYEQIKPAWMCTQEEFATEQEYVKALTQRYAGQVELPGYIPGWLHNLYYHYNEMSYDGSMVAELTEGQLIYSYMASYDIDGETITECYDNCTLRGTVDGEEWILYYENFIPSPYLDSGVYGSVYSGGTICRLVIAPVNQKYYGDYNMVQMSSPENYLDTTTYGENVSDETLCRQMAYDFVEKLGLSDDMEIVYANNYIVTDEEEGSRLDGYRMYLLPVINGVQNYFSDTGCVGTEKETDTEDDEESGYLVALQEYIAVDVSSEGVCGVLIGNQYEMGECMTKQANMLTFEQIDMIAQEYMQEYVNMTFNTEYLVENIEISIDRVELSYATIQYEEGYSIVPVWMYYLEYDKKRMFHEAFFGINALDGSIVTIMYIGNYDYMFYR